MFLKNIQFVLIFIVSIVILSGCEQDEINHTQAPASSRLELANAYQSGGLFQAAVDEYLLYLKENQLETGRQANTYYMIANIYFERVNDYEKALEYYFKVKYLYPESNLQGEIAKKIVSCLERLQRSTDAVRVMERESALNQDKTPENRPGQIIAEIGDRKFTQGDLDFQITKLPPYMQDQFRDKNAKKQFLQQMIAEELLYKSAKRKGLDKEKEVIEAAFQTKKALMVQKLLQDEIQDKVKIEPEDVQLYYKANKDKYAEKDDDGKIIRHKPFNEAAQQAARDLAMERQQKETQKIIERLMQAKDVKIYDSRIR